MPTGRRSVAAVWSWGMACLLFPQTVVPVAVESVNYGAHPSFEPRRDSEIRLQHLGPAGLAETRRRIERKQQVLQELLQALSQYEGKAGVQRSHGGSRDGDKVRQKGKSERPRSHREEDAVCPGGSEFAAFRIPKSATSGADACTSHFSLRPSCSCRQVYRHLQKTGTSDANLAKMCCRILPTLPPPRTTLQQVPTRSRGDTSGQRFVKIPPAPNTPITVVPWPLTCNTFPSGKCAPAIVIAGAKKCGTNSVAAMLKQHPYAKFKGQSLRGHKRIVAVGGTYFSENWFLDCGVYNTPSAEWAVKLYQCNRTAPKVELYSDMFVNTDWYSTFPVDRSPMVSVAPGTARRLRKIAPDARIVVVTCEPISRAWSSFNHENKMWLRSKWGNISRLGDRIRTTTKNAKRLLAEYGQSYSSLVSCMKDAGHHTTEPDALPLNTICRELLLPGLYFDGLTQYFRHFRPHQVIVVDGKWFFQNQQVGAKYLYDALGVPAEPLPTKSKTGIRMNRGSQVNPGYLNISLMPPDLLATLFGVYNRTRSAMAAEFGEASIELPRFTATINSIMNPTSSAEEADKVDD